MSGIEIPLLRESRSFVVRLAEAVNNHGGGKYKLALRINWSYRSSSYYYNREAEIFTANPDAYIQGNADVEPRVEDVFTNRIGNKDLLKIGLKVVVHWLFLGLGSLSWKQILNDNDRILRKGYVDDIELVFDPDADGVLRLIFPFPLGFRRQRRYLRRLMSEGRRFMLCGNAYGFTDFCRVVATRRIGAVQRLETRAQLRLGQRLSRLAARKMEMSDEFDIGSLDFCRTLHRAGFEIVNSAHGVGKYLPVHAFDHFYILTEQQQAYYTPLRPCRYALRSLNAAPVAVPEVNPNDPVNAVILGQAGPHVSPFVRDAETELLRRADAELGVRPGIRLYYKPHPNNADPAGGYPNIALLTDLKGINAHPKTVFCSFFSTCQVDPAFQGEKFLLSAPMIYPQIAFDPDEPIMSVDEFINHVIKMAAP